MLLSTSPRGKGARLCSRLLLCFRLSPCSEDASHSPCISYNDEEVSSAACTLYTMQGCRDICAALSFREHLSRFAPRGD